MFVLQSYAWAVVFCVITMLCWGSWANTQKLARKGWRFELFYWDYTIGVLLLTLIFAYTLGMHGAAGRPFVEDLHQASIGSVGSALLGGAISVAASVLSLSRLSVRRISAVPGRNASNDPGSARVARTIASAICGSIGRVSRPA